MKHFIYHICSRTDWVFAQKAGVYGGDTLATEGFIHCSTRTQSVPTANTFFAEQSRLVSQSPSAVPLLDCADRLDVVLEIDPERLDANLVYEDTVEAGQDFPHIYGAINLNTIFAVHDFEPGRNGKFTYPI